MHLCSCACFTFLRCIFALVHSSHASHTLHILSPLVYFIPVTKFPCANLLMYPKFKCPYLQCHCLSVGAFVVVMLT